MVRTPVYLDNQSTTRVDPRVVEAMAPYWTEVYGNAGSTSHPFGWDARDAVDAAREEVAAAIGASAREIVFTSGATESNNLALRGLVERPRRNGNRIVSVQTEHKAILDPLKRLGRGDVEVELLDVEPHESPRAGWLDPDRLAASLNDNTLLVSVMLANNEIGTIQPLAEIAERCREQGVLLHCDATQAPGKIEVDVEALGVDLMSFSAHKVYGPMGVGALYVRRRSPPIRLSPLIEGGGQENGRRSGTLNVPGIIGFAACLNLAKSEREEESKRVRRLRDLLHERLTENVDGVLVNGPRLDEPQWRLGGNLNCSFEGVDGEALMMSMRDVAVSSGSACTSANPEPSHVLRAIGLSDDRSRSSLRFGVGRFNTEAEILFTVERLKETVTKLRNLGRG